MLRVAEEVLERKALRDITIEELASAAGITRPTFYFYFESKYSLLAALLERFMVDKFAAAATWLARPPELSPRAALQQTFTDAIASWRQHAAVARESADAMGLDADLRATYLGLMGRFIEAATTQIERERDAGLAPPGVDAPALATTLMWMVERSMHAAVADLPPAVPDSDRVAALVEIWLRSVYRHDDPPA